MPITSRGPRGGSTLPSYAPSAGADANLTRGRARRWSWHPPTLPLPGRLPLSRRLTRALLYAIPAAVLLLIAAYSTWELHVEIAAYPRSWIRDELKTPMPLAGCFKRPEAEYNVSERLYGARTTEVHPGRALRTGRECYAFAATVRTTDAIPSPGTGALFHTYWRHDLAKFDKRQEWYLRSMFATQPGARLIMWSNGDLSANPTIARYLKRYPSRFQTIKFDSTKLARGTALENSELLKVKDARAWIDGDLVRLIVLWQHGGVWVDMDSLLTRDLTPLLEHEFVTQWDCYGAPLLPPIRSCYSRLRSPADKKYSPFNGALMHFKQHSAYLCEAFHLMANSHPPRAGSTDWGSLLYLRLHEALLAGGIPPFKILPWCFSDARSCRLDNRLPDPFVPDAESTRGWGGAAGWWGALEEGGALDGALHSVWSVHLHNLWDKAFPRGGWVERLLLKRYEAIELGESEGRGGEL
jgi:hypothetical protein